LFVSRKITAYLRVIILLQRVGLKECEILVPVEYELKLPLAQTPFSLIAESLEALLGQKGSGSSMARYLEQFKVSHFLQ